MEDTTADLFLAMSVTFSIFGVCYYYLITRNKERMAIIEKGLPKDFFKGAVNYLPFLLLLAIVSLGISAGILAGGILDSMNLGKLGNYLFPCVMFLFLGISLLVAHAVLKNSGKRDE
jgi:hypothetical protein